jgi:hypothetical protein
VNTEMRTRLAVLKRLIKKEKDPTELMQMVLEVLALYDEIDGKKRDEKPLAS